MVVMEGKRMKDGFAKKAMQYAMQTQGMVKKGSGETREIVIDFLYILFWFDERCFSWFNDNLWLK